VKSKKIISEKLRVDSGYPNLGSVDRREDREKFINRY
jgi:hypothetical protein